MSFKEDLLKRSSEKCELCSSEQNLNPYHVSPYNEDVLEKSALICSTCYGQIENLETIDINHWHCLNESMWSEFPAVQVLAWRLLDFLKGESWAQDLLEQLYLEDEVKKWACEGAFSNDSESTNTLIVKDSNGAQLIDGDSVTLIKDLVVKGANFTAKRGTLVKKISLTSNPEHIEGRVNGTQIVLLTCYLKKA